MNLSKIREQYLNDGVVLIKNVYSKEEVAKMRASILNTLIDTKKNAKYSEGGKIQYSKSSKVDFPTIIFWPALINKYLNQIRCDKRVQDIVKSILGDDVIQANNQVYFRLPHDNDSFNWHQDISFRTNFNPTKNILQDYLQSIICIDPINNENSPIEFYKNSHILGDLKLIGQDKIGFREYEEDFKKKNLENYELLRINAEPGDMVIWSLYTVHGSNLNTSNSSRMTYMNGFCRKHTSNSWPYYLKNGKILNIIDNTRIPYE